LGAIFTDLYPVFTANTQNTNIKGSHADLF